MPSVGGEREGAAPLGPRLANLFPLPGSFPDLLDLKQQRWQLHSSFGLRPGLIKSQTLFAAPPPSPPHNKVRGWRGRVGAHFPSPFSCNPGPRELPTHGRRGLGRTFATPAACLEFPGHLGITCPATAGPLAFCQKLKKQMARSPRCAGDRSERRAPHTHSIQNSP